LDHTRWERFRFVYGHINGDKGLMLFISAAAGIHNPSQLGLTITSSEKSPKRIQRLFATHLIMHKCRLLTSYEADTGTVYEALLPNGKLFRALDFNMDLLSPEMQAEMDGSGHCSMFGPGILFTGVGPWGSDKGVYSNNPLLTDYDLIHYGSKKEVALNDGNIFVGALGTTRLHELYIDPQTLLNSGGYEDDLCVKYGMDAMNEMKDLLFSDNEDALVEHFAKLVNISDDSRRKLNSPKVEWSLVKAMKNDHQSKAQPVFFRRTVNHGMRTAVDIVRGRIFIKDGCRVYARPYPNMIQANGMPDPRLDNLSGKHDGIPMVCMPDVKEGQALVLRNPNTNSSEMILTWNIHMLELKQYKGEGWCFFGSDAGELLVQLNGGDMDDNLVVLTDPAFIAKWQTMRYPVQTKIRPVDRQTPAEVAVYRERYLGIGKFWSYSVFNEQLKIFVEYSDSLGSFINDGMLDTCLSGEHRTSISACLENGTFVVPENFSAPTRKELDKILQAELWKFIPADYEPSLENFVHLCKIMIEHKPDFICARAMSNSDAVIDMLQQSKGDRNLVSSLIAEAKEARRTLFFPMSYEGRIPMVAGGLNIAATRKEMVRAEMGRRWLKPSCRPDSLPGIMTMESNFQQTGLTPSRPSIRYAATYSTAPRASNADHNIQIVHCAFQMLVRILPMPCL
jgi:hypothetical protein